MMSKVTVTMSICVSLADISSTPMSVHKRHMEYGKDQTRLHHMLVGGWLGRGYWLLLVYIKVEPVLTIFG